MKKLILALMMFAPLTTFAQQKFAHLNAQEIMESMPEFIKARGEVEAQSKIYENDIKSMEDEIKRKSEEYDKAKSTMPAAKQQETETELQTLYQKYRQTVQDNSEALQKLNNEKLQPITTKLLNAIKAVGDKGGYVYIMDVSSGIPYINTNISKDVTADVKAELAKTK